MQQPPLARRLFAEALGSFLLVLGVVGSGIQAASLAPQDLLLALVANSLATVGVLIFLIASLGHLSGAHMNPVVSLVAWLRGALAGRDVLPYSLVQIIGACLGAMTANLIFSLPAVNLSTHHRASLAHLFAELIATAGLLLVIWMNNSRGALKVGALVAAYIGAAYFFTSSTSFANPAVTIARSLSNSFAGIAPSSILPFIGAQLVGAAVGIGVLAGLGNHREGALIHD